MSGTRPDDSGERAGGDGSRTGGRAWPPGDNGLGATLPRDWDGTTYAERLPAPRLDYVRLNIEARRAG